MAFGQALASTSDMGLEALKKLYEGTLVPEGMTPTQTMIKKILGMGDTMYELYGPSLGDDWLKQYLPAEGAPITAGMRQAIQGFERAAAENRGVSDIGAGLADAYKFAGIPTLQSTIGEGQHEAWQLGQAGRWYNPYNKTFGEAIPAVQQALSAMSAEQFSNAGAAPPLGDMTFTSASTVPGVAGTEQGANLSLKMEPILPQLSQANSYYNQVADIEGKGMMVAKTLRDRALAEEHKLRTQAGGSSANKTEVEAYLASLALKYNNPEDFQEDLMKHYEEIVQVIGEPGFRRLHDTVTEWIQGVEAQKTNPRWQFWKQQVKTTPKPQKPRMDLIGEFINQAFKD